MQSLLWLRSAHFRCMTECSTKYGSVIRKQSTTAEKRGGIHSQKVAILTGSTDGIGLDIARRLAQEGASVVVSSRKKTNVERAVEELRAENLSVSGVVCHVGKEEDRQRLVNKALEEYGAIDYMISNAAVNPFVGNMLDSTVEVWDKIFHVNVTSVFLMVQLSVPHMQKRGGGSIVLTSSVAAYNPLPIIGPYCVSKTALFSLTKVLAKVLAPMNMQVNCLAPGLTQTKFGNVLCENESIRESFLKTCNIPRPHEGIFWSTLLNFTPDEGGLTSATGGVFPTNPPHLCIPKLDHFIYNFELSSFSKICVFPLVECI